ncbi:MAG: T9SS type B sorting domain-containing protein [Bacteroidetes bacterium]|nr:MAG: T9SS type B sorting domain-containing protein [Bacteroidota bacterium]
MRQLLLVLTFISLGYVYAQDVILDGTSGIQNVVTCSGNFFDTGGDGPPDEITAFYQDAEDDTITICPDEAGKLLRMIVVDYRIQQNDNLIIYDGDDVTANQLGIYSAGSEGYDLQTGDTIQASTSNTTGCLTFVFISDNDTKTDQGWNFEISCFFPCQEVIATGTFDGLTPSQRNEPIKICENDIVNLAGFGIYPDINTPKELYNQENSTSQFTWIVTPGNPVNSPPSPGTSQYDAITDSTFSFIQFPDSGIYHIKLEIKDENPDNECKNSNYLSQVVWVSGPPIFAPTGLMPVTRDTICLGDENIIVTSLDPVKHIDDCVPPTGTLEFIPDGQDKGSGLTYESEAEYRCYPIDVNVPGSGIINNGTDIVSICMDIEHSAIGDLEISLTCPSGQTVRFLTQAFGENANLGTPIDIPGNTAQGTVDTYCFDMVAASTMASVATTLTTVQKLPPGNYLPLDNFDNFIGCEINGNWVLTVKDGRINDNGYVGNWNMVLDPSIQPTFGDEFENVYVDTVWSENVVPPNPATGSIISSLADADTLRVSPKTIGRYCYNVQVTDDFGCMYDTTVCFIVLDRDTADFEYPINLFCEDDPSTISPNYINNGRAGEFTVDPPTGLVVDPATGTFTPNGSTPGTYTITNTVLNAELKCPDVHTFDVTIVDTVKPIITANPTYCQIDTAILVNEAAFVSYTWSNGFTNDTTFVSDADNPITLTAIDANGCETTSDPITVTSLAQTQTNQTIMICEGGSAVIHGIVQTEEGVYSETFSTGQTSCDSVSVVTLMFYPQVTLGPDQNICFGNSATLTASGVDAPANFTWSNNFLGQTQTVSPVTDQEYSVVATDVHGCQSRDTLNVTVSTVRDGTIEYSGASFCPGSPNILPLSIATPGGVFSSSIPGLVDPTTGEVFLSAAPPGQFTVTYQLQPFNACDIVGSVTFTITNAFDGALSYAAPFCTNGGVVSPNFAGTGAGTFTVSPAIGLSLSPTTGAIDLSASAAGTYTITNSPAAGCPGTPGETTITISDPPSVSASAAPVPVCQGQQVTLTATSADATDFAWTNGLSGQSVSYTPTNSETVTVTATDASTGCSATNVTTVVVNFLPVLQITSADPTICEGTESTTLVATVINNSAGDPMTYTWTPGGDQGQSITVNPNTTTTYTVNATNQTTGCSSDQNTNATFTVTVLPLPTITVDASPGANICLGDQVTLNASGTDISSIQWAPATVTNGVPFTPGAVGTDTYTAVGFGTNGCATLPQTIDVTVNALPTLTLTGNNAQICDDGHTEQLSVEPADGSLSYQWDNGETASTITVVPSVATPTFCVTGTDGNGCSTQECHTFDVIANTVSAGFTADPTTGNPGLVVNFTNESTGANDYVWNFGNGSPEVNATTLAGQTATYADTSVYVVSLIATNTTNGCKDTALVTINVVPFDGAILHIPNIFTPDGDGTNDGFFIDVTNKQGKEMHVEVYNRWGSLLKTIDDFVDFWDGTHNGKPASEGVYFFKYRVVGNDGNVTEGHGNVTLIRN